MNALQILLTHKKQNLLSLFFTAGFPTIDASEKIIASASRAGIDFLEVGMPYSDPLADGPVIQHSSTKAIANGMNIPLLMEQLIAIKGKYDIPLILMGYLNPVLQYGTEKFLSKAAECGVSGIILPDLPMPEYLEEYQQLFVRHNLNMIFLITPNTSDERIRMIDDHSNAFIYVVSSASTTGGHKDFGDAQKHFFQRLHKLQLKNPLVAGFGIHNAQTLQQAWSNLNGAICGSAFLKKLEQYSQPEEAVEMLQKDLGLR